MPKTEMIKLSFHGEDVVKALQRRQKEYEKAISRTILDMKSRAPGAVASAVTETFNIKKSEITPASKTSSKSTKKATSVKVVGERLESLALVYRGRVLTPTHFGMTPKVPPMPAKKYKIKYEIKKGTKQTLEGKPNLAKPPFLAPNGYGQNIPFQRRIEGRDLAYSVRTVSVPQMIKNERDVQPELERRLTELLSKRLDYHMSKIK